MNIIFFLEGLFFAAVNGAAAALESRGGCAAAAVVAGVGLGCAFGGVATDGFGILASTSVELLPARRAAFGMRTGMEVPGGIGCGPAAYATDVSSARVDASCGLSAGS